MSMFDRLEDTLRRYEDVTAELGNPDIVTDQDKFRKYTLISKVTKGICSRGIISASKPFLVPT